MTRPTCLALDEPAGPTIDDQLREAVVASGLTFYSLGYHRCRPQLNPSLISRFVHGKRTLTLRSASALAYGLGMTLVKVRPGAAEKT